MTNYGYSRYQYETSPRKLAPENEPYVRPNTKNNKTTAHKTAEKPKQKLQLKTKIKAVVYIFLIFASLLVISYRNSQINESFNENEGLKSNLAAIQKENEQMKVNLENSLNLSNIEKMAREKLRMQKLDSSQKVYVSLDKKDYVEPASEEVVIQEENWLTKLLNTLLGKD